MFLAEKSADLELELVKFGGCFLKRGTFPGDVALGGYFPRDRSQAGLKMCHSANDAPE